MNLYKCYPFYYYFMERMSVILVLIQLYHTTYNQLTHNIPNMKKKKSISRYKLYTKAIKSNTYNKMS